MLFIRKKNSDQDAKDELTKVSDLKILGQFSFKQNMPRNPSVDNVVA